MSFSLARYLCIETSSTIALIFSLLIVPRTKLITQPIPTIAIATGASFTCLALSGLALKAMALKSRQTTRGPSTLLLLGPLTLATFAILVLFGASLTTLLVKTMSLAAYVTVMTWTPALVVYGTTWEDYQWVFGQHVLRDQMDRVLVYPALGSMIGCWAGAIPIPLDWNRPWQTWPITCILGTLLGRTVGSMISIIACIDQDEVTHGEQARVAEKKTT